MKKINVCPSTLQEGYETYSPQATKLLFDGETVSHVFAGPSPEAETEEVDDVIKSIGRISLSGAQPKFSVLLENGKFKYTQQGEQGTFI